MAKNKNLSVTFPGNKQVDVHYNGITVHTDQSVHNGGEGSGPEPFDLFWVSLASCAGIYAKEFCDARKVDATGLDLSMEAVRNEEKRCYDHVIFRLTPPPALDSKYYKALVRAINLCTVKKHVLHPPAFDIELIL